MPAKTLDEMKSPTRKLVAFFKSSRDSWKSKYMDLKLQSVAMKNQVFAVEKSREQWRKRAKAAEAQVARLLAESQKKKSVSQVRN